MLRDDPRSRINVLLSGLHAKNDFAREKAKSSSHFRTAVVLEENFGSATLFMLKGKRIERPFLSPTVSVEGT